jgi:hypothetical protein
MSKVPFYQEKPLEFPLWGLEEGSYVFFHSIKNPLKLEIMAEVSFLPSNRRARTPDEDKNRYAVIIEDKSGFVIRGRTDYMKFSLETGLAKRSSGLKKDWVIALIVKPESLRSNKPFKTKKEQQKAAWDLGQKLWKDIHPKVPSEPKVVSEKATSGKDLSLKTSEKVPLNEVKIPKGLSKPRVQIGDILLFRQTHSSKEVSQFYNLAGVVTSVHEDKNYFGVALLDTHHADSLPITSALNPSHPSFANFPSHAKVRIDTMRCRPLPSKVYLGTEILHPKPDHRKRLISCFSEGKQYTETLRGMNQSFLKREIHRLVESNSLKELSGTKKGKISEVYIEWNLHTFPKSRMPIPSTYSLVFFRAVDSSLAELKLGGLVLPLINPEERDLYEVQLFHRSGKLFNSLEVGKLNIYPIVHRGLFSLNYGDFGGFYRPELILRSKKITELLEDADSNRRTTTWDVLEPLLQEAFNFALEVTPKTFGEASTDLNPMQEESLKLRMKAQALQNCRLYASRNRGEAWAQTILKFCAEAGEKPVSRREPIED